MDCCKDSEFILFRNISDAGEETYKCVMAVFNTQRHLYHHQITQQMIYLSGTFRCVQNVSFEDL